MNSVKLGLKQNWRQFTLLVIVNSFVGGMVGLERSILPKIAQEEFGIAATTAILSFIVVFGFTKAITNYFTGALSNRFGRKKLLIAGWLVGIPVPFILMMATNWNWIVAANVLLGINQGLAWSSTVVMKIDLVGDKHRGMAMGLNEFAGYLAVAAVAFLTGYVAGEYGLRPYPFYIGFVLVFFGLFTSIFLIKDTQRYVDVESVSSKLERLKNVFWDTTLYNRNLGSVTQAGLVNNLNDGMVWGLFPVLLFQKGFAISEIGIISAVYPAVWGLSQLFTGKMSDYYCKKSMLFWGMFIQGLALLLLIFASSFLHYLILSVILGFGTAMVYPTFLATVAENTHPQDRAKSMGIFRFWRDMGYAIGALVTGILADMFGINSSLMVIALLTIGSALIVEKRMRCLSNSPKLTDWLIRPNKKSCKNENVDSSFGTEAYVG